MIHILFAIVTGAWIEVYAVFSKLVYICVSTYLLVMFLDATIYDGCDVETEFRFDGSNISTAFCSFVFI